MSALVGCVYMQTLRYKYLVSNIKNIPCKWLNSPKEYVLKTDLNNFIGPYINE